MAQITPTSTIDRTTEADYAIFANPTANGSAGNPTASIVKNPDVGAASQAPATDMSGSKTGMEVVKGIFNLLTNLLNATTLNNSPTTTTFTIPLDAALSNYQELTGRSWIIFVPPGVGAHFKVRVKNNVGDSTGIILRDKNANPHTFNIHGSEDRLYSAEATACFIGCVKHQIAFERYTDATTPVATGAALTITLKAVV